MSDDKPSGSTQIVQNNDPWSGQQPFLQDVFKQAQTLSKDPRKQYPDSRVVDFSPQTEQALGMYESRATQGSDLQRAGQQSMQDTASGSYLGAGNPYFQNMYNAASRPVIEQFNEQVMPGVNATFSGNGRYGSGMHSKAIESSVDSLGQNLTNMAGSMAYQNYNDERQRMMGASALAPQIAQADYADIGQLERVGQVREGLAGAQLQDDIDKFNFQQNEPRDRLAEYAALVAGGSFGGQSTSTQPIFRDPVAQGLGYASTGAGILGSLNDVFGMFGS